MNNYENIPKKLRETELFCLWRNEDGRKIPYQTNGKRARVTDPGTFTDFDTAIAALTDEYDGIGMLLRNCIGIDDDDCMKDGVPDTFAQELIETLDTYTEISPSGNGLHFFIYAPGLEYDKAKYYLNNRDLGLEIYVPEHTNRFLTLTGNIIHGDDAEERTEELQTILDEHMLKSTTTKHIAPPACPGSYLSDDSVIHKAAASKQGDKFRALWGGEWRGKYSSHSEADLALAVILAFWCGGDKEQMDRLFRKSGLYRNKWDEKRGAEEYGVMTISKAVDLSNEFYTPLVTLSASDDFNDIVSKLKDMGVEDDPRYKHGDLGSGRLFADIFKDIARYVPERKMYFVYDGIRWVPDIGNLKAMELCKTLSDALLIYASSIHDEGKRSFFTDSAKKWFARRSREVYLKEAQSVYPISASLFDSSKYLLNCLNGTYDLSTGMFREHDAKDLITKLAPTIYDPAAYSERFIRFIDEIMCSDTAMARFLQKIYGYGISGETFLECLFFLFGITTRNGKGTLAESTKGTLGDYAIAVRPETIAQKNNINSQAPSEDIARLAGKRLVNISEPKQGMVLNAALVKSMTGNDTLNARFLHENSFDFTPQFKLYINTNHLPSVTDMTLFTSGRIIVVPFDRHFNDWEQDKTLKEEFSKPEVRSAILNWLIEGYNMLKSEGLELPTKVLAAVNAYSDESDKIRQFSQACLLRDASSDVRTSEVYIAYRNWCTDNGYYPENRKNFNQSLRTIGEVIRKRPADGGEKTTVLAGYTLLTPEFL